MLDEKQEDALKEFMNIYIGQASSLLSEMIQEKIELQIPEVKLVNITPGKKPDSNSLSILPRGHVISSTLSFGEDLKGKARLVFPAEKTSTLVSLCLGEKPGEGKEFDINNITETDADAIREIGNIVLNAVMGGLGNLTKTRLNYTLPGVELLYFSDIEDEVPLEDSVYVLIIKNTFCFSQTKIEGAILVALSMDSVSWLIEKLDEVLEDMYE